jgi:hypothetical protein
LSRAFGHRPERRNGADQQRGLQTMLWTDDTSDPQDLRNYIRDLIALSALPAIWRTISQNRSLRV